MSALDTLIEKGRDVKLPSLPVVGLKILEVVRGDNFSVHDLAEIISTDPALAARILRLANSTLYHNISKVDTIERAITILGANTLKNLALSFVIIREMRREDVGGFDYERFWKKAVTAAVAAKTLSRYLEKRADDIYVTALLMNIGKTVIYTYRPDDYLDVLGEERITGKDISDIEKSTFGFDHQKVGKELLEKWNIPDNIFKPIAFHHDITDCPEEFIEKAVILKVSSTISAMYTSDRSVAMLDRLYGLLEDRFGFDETRANGFIDDVAVKTVEVLAIYDIEPGDMKPYSELMEEANQEFSNLGLAYERLVIDLKESKARAESRSEELMESLANIKTLKGLLPICAWCKKVKDDKGYWKQVESYVSKHSEVKFTHGQCPQCAKKMIEKSRKK